MTGSEIKVRLAKAMDRLSAKFNPTKEYKFYTLRNMGPSYCTEQSTEEEIRACINSFFSNANIKDDNTISIDLSGDY